MLWSTRFIDVWNSNMFFSIFRIKTDIMSQIYNCTQHYIYRNSYFTQSFLIMVKEIIQWEVGEFLRSHGSNGVFIHHPLRRQEVPQTGPITV